MVELGRCLGFLLESVDHLGVMRYVRRQDLDGDLSLEHQVLSQKYHGHSSPAEQSGDLIAAGQGASQALPQLIGRIGRKGMGDFPRRRSAVGAEPAIRRQRRMALGALAHRVPFCRTGFALRIPTAGWYIGLQALMRVPTRGSRLW